MGKFTAGYAKTFFMILWIGISGAMLIAESAPVSVEKPNPPGSPEAVSKAIPWISVQDSINPGTGAHISDSIEKAAASGAPFLVLALNTPGGLLTTTRQIVQDMLNCPIPIVVYVSPQGAHAGSAGALITFASDVAVMAPGTNIGAAHPVMGGGEKMDENMAAKLANDTAAFARSLAKAKGRNTDWAEKAVKSSASLTSEEALKQGVIDFIAADASELGKLLSGFKLKAKKGAVTELPAGPFEFQNYESSLRHRIVSFFSDPNLAYLILSLGALCIWIELSHPGLILPGVVGAICILVSLVSFQLMPISYGALGLLLVGLALLIAELFVPSYGVLGTGGVVAFILGSLFLMDTTDPMFQISLKVIFPTAATLILALLGLAVLVYRVQRQRPRSGTTALLGELAEVKQKVGEKPGKVFLHGESWSAVSASQEEFPVGSIVQVKAVRDLLLIVTERKPEARP